MKIRKADRRCVGRYAEYPGAYAWPEYEYRCPDCDKWHGGGDTVEVHSDGTESVLCPSCAAQLDELFEDKD